MEHLRVFVSSTQKDLQPERDTAETVIALLGHQCMRAETYDSPGTSPVTVCRDLAKQCDIYLGIYGPAYGYKVPDSGMSATELEYREAREDNPNKVFIYVQHIDDSRLEDEQRRFLQEVQDFSHGYFRHERFADTAELADQIRRDIVTWTTRRVRGLLAKEIENQALRDKIAHLSRVMELYGIPEDLR